MEWVDGGGNKGKINKVAAFPCAALQKPFEIIVNPIFSLSTKNEHSQFNIHTHNIQCVLLRQVIEPVIFWAKFYNFISISATRGKKKPGTEKNKQKIANIWKSCGIMNAPIWIKWEWFRMEKRSSSWR